MRAQEDLVTEIDVKQAVSLAKDFAAKIYKNEKIARLGLEAVERTEDGKHWLVTLGFSRPWSQAKPRKQEAFKTPLEQALSYSREPQPDREYKVFRVDAESGAVVSVEMFE